MKLIFKSFILCCTLHSIYGNFEILILHNNDMHSRFDQTDATSALLDPQNVDTATFGGFARVKTAVSEAREEAKQKGIASIFLNAGDTFQGTSFYTLLKTDVVADLISMLGIDAMCLGNHEFDDGPIELLQYLQKINIPVVASNLNFSQDPGLNADPFINKRLIKEVADRRIGIVGSLATTTNGQSSTGKVIFLDEIESIKKEAAILKSEGVNIIIALTHIGFDMDLKVAKEVPDVSLVIGGHTNTFLYNPPDKRPSTETPAGPYPYYVTQDSGKRVPVVSAYAYTKYLGKLWATFDDNGNFISAAEGSNAILLDSTVAMDPEVQKRVTQWRSKINDKIMKVVGQTNVEIDTWKVRCKILECNLGNLITDSMVDYIAEKYNGTTGWTDTPIALLQSGSMKVNHHQTKIRANLTYDEILAILPYRSAVVKIHISGSTLKTALEHSVSQYKFLNSSEVPNEFLQVSGLHVTYDMSRSPGNRVIKVDVRCGNCTIPEYLPLDEKVMYTVAALEFITRGGDGFDMFKGCDSERIVGDDGQTSLTDTDAMARFIEKYKMVYPEVSGRIVVIRDSASHSNSTSYSCYLLVFLLILLYSS